MKNREIRNILQSRMLEYRGYKNKQIKSLRFKQQIVGNTFTLAPLVVMGIFVIASFIIGLTFLNTKGTLSPDLGLVKSSTLSKNWQSVMKDPLFKSAIKNTLLLAAIVLGVTVILPLLIASILNLSNIRGKKVFQIAFFLPLVTSDIASTIIFSAFASKGLNVNEHPENYFWVIAFILVWVQSASAIVNYNTAFTNIGRTEYEAAELDGANEFVKFFKITIPAMGPIIIYQVITTLAMVMTAFGQSYALIMMGYVSVNDLSGVILWPVIGFMRIVANGNILANNIGVGMIELTLLGCTILALSLISNAIQPIKGRD